MVEPHDRQQVRILTCFRLKVMFAWHCCVVPSDLSQSVVSHESLAKTLRPPPVQSTRYLVTCDTGIRVHTHQHPPSV